MNNSHDNLIIKILISGIRNLPNTRRIQKINKGLCPNIMSYLMNRYDDIDKDCKLSEIIYRIYFNQEKRNYCLICGNKTKFDIKGYKFHGHPYLYSTYCCVSCCQKSVLTQNKIKKTCLERYGVTNGGASKQAQDKIKKTCLERYGVTNNMLLNSFKEQREKTWKNKYGTDHPLKSDIIKDKIKNTCLSKYGSTWTSNNEISIKKQKHTNLIKYGVTSYLLLDSFKEQREKTWKNKYSTDHPLKSDIIKDKIKNTCLERYGVDSPLKLLEVRQKIFHTNIQKGRSSKKEEILYEELLKYFDRSDIYRQYKNEKYPYFCDFYIKSIDTYIEYQGTWLHGTHPYNEKNQIDINTLSFMLKKSNNSNYYKSAIKCWTIRDVQKRNLAINNKIRYIEIFSLNNIDFIEIKSKLKNKYIVYL